MVRKLIARFAAWMLGVTRPTTELVQIHLSGSELDERDYFQVAQKRFAIDGDEGAKLAWLSEVVGRCAITAPNLEIFRETREKLLLVEGAGEEFGPTFLTDVRGGDRAVAR